MVYRYTLPAQRSPYACQQRELCLRSQTISNAIASSPGLKRASLYAHRSLDSKEASLNYKPRVEQLDKENVKITTCLVSSRNILDENMGQYDPADPTTWGIKPLPPLPHGSGSRKALSITSSSDDDATMLQSPILAPYAEPAEDPNNLAQLIGDHLGIDDEQQSHTQHRTTSSFYHDPDSEPSRVQSPISNGNVNMLSVTNLAKYGKTNDRLSNLGSGTPSSDTADLLLQESGDAQDDSSSVVND
ncbi:hypothetical protein MY11210_000137 [Beauveria gryllotalpidicola]